jgi:dTDP-4-dehydrorhamnose 3,5-epimerase
MKITPTRIPDVLLIEPNVFGDERGFFMETYHAQKYAEHGIAESFVQDNHSRSSKGVLRGLHYQLEKPQGKLVRVVTGAVFDVAVDIRQGSPTFGEWVGYELSDSNHLQVYIPPGFAHGFCVLSETADFLYKCTDFYAPETEHGIQWNDPAIGIEWPGQDFVISEKDQGNKALSEMQHLLPIYRETV